MPWKRAPNCATGPFRTWVRTVRSVKNQYNTAVPDRLALCCDDVDDAIQAWEILCEFTKSDSLRGTRWPSKPVSRPTPASSARTRRSGPSPRCCTISIGRSTPTCRIIPTKGEPILAERGVAGGDPPGDPVACRFHRRAARHAARENALCVRRTRRLPHRLQLRQAGPEHCRSGSGFGPPKKMKDKAFARQVNRDDIRHGAEELGIRPGGAHRFLHRGHEGTRRGTRPGRHGTNGGLVRSASFRAGTDAPSTRRHSEHAAASPLPGGSRHRCAWRPSPHGNRLHG